MRLSCFLVFLAGCCTVVAAGAAPTSELARQAIFVAPGGATAEDAAIVRWQQRAQRASNAPALERLGWAFVAKARATHDDGYYTLALLTADVLADRHGATPGERLLRGHVLLNLHQFLAAEEIARALAASDSAPLAHALLSDALLEQGRIADAVAVCQRFVAAAPGFEAYARVAHLRWLTGDVSGAADAMRRAVAAVSPRDGTSLAWALTRLAAYELQLGRAPRALQLAESALRAKADFAPALLARGQALLALERAPDAVAPLRRAAELVPEPAYQWWLADAQRAHGDVAAAEKTEAALLRHGARADPRTFSLFLATRARDLDRAAALARRELETRADPHTLDALAWALFAAGSLAEAETTLQRALAAGTDDPRLQLHAAALARAQGRTADARAHLARATAGAGVLTPSERDRLDAERAALRDDFTS